METTDNALINELQSLPLTGCKFVSIKGYENQQGDVSDYLFNAGISYENAKKADIAYLEDYVPTEEEIAILETKLPANGNLKGTVRDLLVKAHAALLAAIKKETVDSIKRAEAQKAAYETVAPATRKHIETGSLSVYGLLQERKVVKTSDTPAKVVKSQPLTVAKNLIRKNMKTDKFRQFKLDGIKTAKLKGKVLLFDK